MDACWGCVSESRTPLTHASSFAPPVSLCIRDCLCARSVTSADVPRTFELVLVPNADGSNNHVAARLMVSLPAKYPEEEASIRIRNEKGLNERQMEALNDAVASKMAECAGEVVVYNVAECVREYLCENNRPVLSMHEQMQARSNAKSSEEEEAIAKRKALEERIEAKKKEPSRALTHVDTTGTLGLGHNRGQQAFSMPATLTPSCASLPATVVSVLFAVLFLVLFSSLRFFSSSPRHRARHAPDA